MAAKALMDFAFDYYERPGVKHVLLSLQDEHGANVVILMWLCWHREEATTPDPQAARFAMAEADCFASRYIEPQRALRRNVLTQEALPALENEALKDKLLAAEIALESHVLKALEQVPAKPGDVSGLIKAYLGMLEGEQAAINALWARLP